MVVISEGPRRLEQKQTETARGPRGIPTATAPAPGLTAVDANDRLRLLSGLHVCIRSKRATGAVGFSLVSSLWNRAGGACNFSKLRQGQRSFLSTGRLQKHAFIGPQALAARMMKEDAQERRHDS